MNQKHYSQDLNKIVDYYLDFKDFDSDRDKIVNNAKLTNVDYLLTISVNLEDFEKVHEVTQNYENIWCTTGIHPNNVSSETDTIQLDDIQNKISENLKNKKVVGLGETGLDFFEAKIEQTRLNHLCYIFYQENIPLLFTQEMIMTQ